MHTIFSHSLTALLRRGRILLPALALLLAACQPSAPATPAPTSTPGPIRLTDALGRAVTLARPAQRIVSLAPSNTEIVFALGAGGRLVGRDEYSDYPPEAAQVPSLGSQYPGPNKEAIVSVQPDLVLAAGITNPDDVQTLADLGLTVYTTHNAKNLEDIYGDILAVGQLIGRPAQAEQLVAGMRARVQVVVDKTAGVTERPKVFYEFDGTDPAKPWTVGPGTFVDQLLGLAGAENVGSLGTDAYFEMSLETLVVADPDLIVLGSATYGGQTPEMVGQRPGWDGLKAVQRGAVYAFDDNLVSRPGPRMVDGLEALARLAHPEVFK